MIKDMRYVVVLCIILLIGAGCIDQAQQKQSNMRIESSAFSQNQSIPSIYTCDGEDKNPPLQFIDVPENAKSLALIVDDPDAPRGDFVHWLVWNIDPATKEIPENRSEERRVGEE